MPLILKIIGIYFLSIVSVLIIWLKRTKNIFLDFNFDEDCLVNNHGKSLTDNVKDVDSEPTEEFNDLGN